MKLDIYQLDAFASNRFEGNPAAIVPLQEWLPDATMQAIATENNLSETAFFVANGDGFHLRWFTPVAEVKLCGHATLATAAVLFDELHYESDQIRFQTLSGELRVSRKGEALQMDFPAQVPTPCAVPPQLIDAFSATPVACLKFDDVIAVFAEEDFVRQVRPNLARLAEIECRGILITAAAKDYDFILRWFGPRLGINEDPVTGSAFTQVVPYWAERLGKSRLTAKQVSARGGEVRCELQGDRVLIAGTVYKYMQGTIAI